MQKKADPIYDGLWFDSVCVLISAYKYDPNLKNKKDDKSNTKCNWYSYLAFVAISLSLRKEEL